MARLPGVSLFHWTKLPYGADITHEPEDNLLPIVVAFWRFVGETWIDSRHMDPGRPARKRNARAGRPEAEIRVIRLRKAEHARTRRAPDEEPDEPLWSHRWIVEGHWRNQWYPSMQAHRPKWIPRHVKGPDHLPLIVKDTVFSVDR